MSLIKEGLITRREKLAPEIYLFTIKEPSIANTAKPGQFVNLAIDNKRLRRPFSIFDSRGEEFKILFRVTGKGTTQLSLLREGSHIDIMGPLGNGFGPIADNPLFVAGGVGAAPLYFLASRSDKKGVFLQGTCRKEEFIDLKPIKEKGHTAYQVSEDCGGFLVTDILKEHINFCGAVYTAGPKAMMKKIYRISRKAEKKCFVTWEERMGCGTGLCFCCVVKTLSGYRLTCTDGPVLNAKEVDWDEY